MLLILAFPWAAPCQNTTFIRSDTFDVANRGWEWEAGNGPASGTFRGRNYLARGYIFPGGYFDKYCPVDHSCGVKVTGSFILSDGSVAYVGEPEDTSIVLGDWLCRGFISMIEADFFATGGGIVDHSAQVYRFYPGKHPICPSGCTIITDGPLKISWPPDSPDPNILNEDRTIAGGSNEARFIRGELEHLAYAKANEENALGATNHKTVFHYTLEENAQPANLDLDVSVKRASLILDGQVDSSGNPKYGTVVILEGVIYKGGTFAAKGPTTGIDPQGNAQWDSIGTWTARGWWVSKEHTLQDGFFAATRETFQFTDDNLGLIEINTDGWDDNPLNSLDRRVVVGATRALSGYRGECSRQLVGFNASTGYNFSYSFDMQQIVGTHAPGEVVRLDFSLYPNPVADRLNVVVANPAKPGTYTLEIADAAGKLALRRPVDILPGETAIALDLSVYPPGNYFLYLVKDGLTAGVKPFQKTGL